MSPSAVELSTSTSVDGRKTYSFLVSGVGGGFIVIDSFGENGITVGNIHIHSLGKYYSTTEDALDDACKLASAMSDKNSLSKINCGGSSIILYAENEMILQESAGDPESSRTKLFDALATALEPNINNVLVCSGKNVSITDLKYLHMKTSQIYPDMKRCPVPSEMVTEEDIISVSTAWSTLGALLALAERKGWNSPKIVIQGFDNIGKKLAELLLEKGWDVFGSDEHEHNLSIIPEKNRLDRSLSSFEECDILAPCVVDGGITSEIADKLNCKAIAGAADSVISSSSEAKILDLLEERKIEYYSGNKINVGGISFAVNLFTGVSYTYEDSLDLGHKNMKLMIHENGVITQYDTDEKRKFYKAMMSDGTNNIHYGLWDGIDIEADGAYGKASINMTEWMWNEASKLVPSTRTDSIQYIDLGSGTGSAARHIVSKYSTVSATCLNICRNQNKENQNINEQLGLSDRIDVVTGSFEAIPDKWTNKYNGCFSQDAFIHAYSKLQTLKEALRITKSGGWLVVSDVLCGDGPTVSQEALHTFAETNMVGDWQPPAQIVKTAETAGWTDVKFVDLTSHIRLSFQLMGKHVSKTLESGKHDGINSDILETYQRNLSRRLGQVDEGVFKWGALIARKP